MIRVGFDLARPISTKRRRATARRGGRGTAKEGLAPLNLHLLLQSAYPQR
jgi:hypothetical protein